MGYGWKDWLTLWALMDACYRIVTGVCQDNIRRNAIGICQQLFNHMLKLMRKAGEQGNDECGRWCRIQCWIMYRHSRSNKTEYVWYAVLNAISELQDQLNMSTWNLKTRIMAGPDHLSTKCPAIGLQSCCYYLRAAWQCSSEPMLCIVNKDWKCAEK